MFPICTKTYRTFSPEYDTAVESEGFNNPKTKAKESDSSI